MSCTRNQVAPPPQEEMFKTADVPVPKQLKAMLMSADSLSIITYSSSCCFGLGYGCRDTKIRIIKTDRDDEETPENEPFYEANQECGNACWGTCCPKLCQQELPFAYRGDGAPAFKYKEVFYKSCCSQFMGGELVIDDKPIVKGVVGEMPCIDCCCMGFCWGRGLFGNPCGAVWTTILGPQPLVTTSRRDENCPCFPVGFGYDIYNIDEQAFRSKCFKPPAITKNHVAYFQHMGRWNKCMVPWSSCFYIPTSEATFGRFRVHEITKAKLDEKYQPQRHTKIDFSRDATAEQRLAALESALSVLPWTDVVGCCPNPAVQAMLG